jgi:hypothetical protein
MENINQALCAIANLCMKSDPVGTLPPATLYHIAQFTKYCISLIWANRSSINFDRTLHKIHIYVGSQQDVNKIKYLFRQVEMNKLLKDCWTGLHQALDVFKVRVR